MELTLCGSANAKSAKQSRFSSCPLMCVVWERQAERARFPNILAASPNMWGAPPCARVHAGLLRFALFAVAAAQERGRGARHDAREPSQSRGRSACREQRVPSTVLYRTLVLPCTCRATGPRDGFSSYATYGSWLCDRGTPATPLPYYRRRGRGYDSPDTTQHVATVDVKLQATAQYGIPTRWCVRLSFLWPRLWRILER